MWSCICPAAKSSGGGRSNRCSRLKCWPLTNRIGTKVRARATLFQKEPARGEIGRAGEVLGAPRRRMTPSRGGSLAHLAYSGLTEGTGPKPRAPLVLVVRIRTAYPHFHSNGSGSVSERLT